MPTRKALIVLAVVVTLIPTAVIAARYPQLRDRCAAGVSRHGPNHDCVGVTDGSYNFPGMGLDAVLQKIEFENHRVERQTGPSVTLAYAVPLDRTKSGLLDEFRHELQGAYLAQLRANQPGPLGGSPLIRLLVANTGPQNGQWKPIVDQLRHEPGSPHPVVAVLGFGESRATTIQAIAALTDRRDPIPVVAGRLTADDLGLGPVPDRVDGLVRIAPTNSDEATAASAFLKPGSRRALLIQDKNEKDAYAESLGKAFTAKFKDATHKVVDPVEGYDASKEGVPNTFAQMMPDICQQRPDVVYFAGRGEDLQKLLEVLPRRTCTDTHITIVTGSDATDLSSVVRRQLASGIRDLRVALTANTTLWYTALAHPDEWEAAPAFFNHDATDPFRPGCSACFQDIFPTESLDDGAAIMSNDAVVTAVTAIHALTRQGPAPDILRGSDPKVIRGAIIQEWNRLQDCSAVPGASGWISLDDRGNPDNKAIPILELTPDGTVKFVELTSPLGQPYVPPPSC